MAEIHSMLKLRRYHPDDYEDIVEISSHIWEGNDYLPKRINQYYHDPRSIPIVIEEASKVVAVANTRLISPAIAWLEAIRTHPSVRGRGFATELTKSQLFQTKELGASKAWLMTASFNTATNKITRKLNFQEIGLYNIWGWKRDGVEGYEDNSPVEIDKDGLLTKIEYLDNHISENAIKLSHKWICVESSSELMTYWDTNFDSRQKKVLLGEFFVYPFDVYEIEDWIENKEVFVLPSHNSFMTIKKSKEKEGKYIVGINTLYPDIIDAGMKYFKDKFGKSYVDLFIPISVHNSLFSIPEFSFKLMEHLID